MVIVIITIQNEYSQPGGITDSFAHVYKKVHVCTFTDVAWWGVVASS